MGKYDKDRFQKELAIRYCLARGAVPFLEVIVPSASDLSDSVEVLTDIDVLGVESVGDGGLRRTIFDCKTANKMSSVNRAFWAAGVKEYTGCDEAYVILKNKAVHNHRISALSISVDLHDERSFKDLGLTVDAAFPADDCYQASSDRWSTVYDCYQKNAWTDSLFDQVRNAVPLTQTPWKTFRKLIADLRAVRGQFDPAKSPHVALFLDTLASTFVLWAGLGRDIRRFYETTMDKTAFEKVLRYYLWGGKEAYSIRQQLREKAGVEATIASPVELPAWDLLVSFAGLVISAPQSLLGCAHVCRELSIKIACGGNSKFDENLGRRLTENSRARQFTTALSDYLVAAGGLPKDFAKHVQDVVFGA
jgi:hypothetical protein